MVWLDTSELRRHWRSAQIFETSVKQVLALAGVSFAEWLLLEALRELREPHRDGLHQAELARATGLSARVVSYWMIRMSEDGLVDRGEGDDPRQWGVMLAERGENTLRACHERLEAAGIRRNF